MTRSLVRASLAALLTLPALAQTPAFLAADVHLAPRRSYPFFFAVVLPENRFVVRDATLVDLLALARDVDPASIQGGPAWLERDRFDIIAKEPAGTSKSDEHLMVAALLADRFHLTARAGTRPMPAYLLTVARDKAKLRPAEAAGEPECGPDRNAPADGDARRFNVFVSCRNMPMEVFAEQIHGMDPGYVDQPVINRTSLDGSWDFDFHWTNRGNLERAGTDGVSLFDALEKQLGLKLTLDTAPRPVVLVDAADRTPTPNAANLGKLMPTPPLPQFEVATIKPAKPGVHGEGHIGPSEVRFTSIRLKDLIDLAWDLNESDSQNLVNAPKWLAEDRFDILAKVSPESSGRPVTRGGNLPMDIYEVEEMLRALLIERFQIKAHMEDRPIDAYTLVAVNPKLKPSDGSSRTLCKEGPGVDGKDPRLANPQLNRLVSCRNMTSAEVADELDRIAGGYLFSPVLDATGLKGSYDFTLSFSSADRMPHAAVTDAEAGASTPNGALSVFDAVNRQLGLKLEKAKRPLPVLVIDHIEEKPTEN